MKQDFQKELQKIQAEGLFTDERIISSQQAAEITLADGSHFLNFCANNYLGLSINKTMLDRAMKILA